MPIHGEYAMQKKHVDLAVQTGVKRENCFILNNGEVLLLNNKGIKKGEKVQSGNIFIDSNDSLIDSNIIKERKLLSEDGMVSCVIVLRNNKLISNPEIISRGFIYMKKSEQLINQIQQKAIDAYKEYAHTHKKYNPVVLKKHITNELSTLIYDLTERKPIIIPIIMELN